MVFNDIAWKGFKKGNWNQEIDVADFVRQNLTSYDGDSTFLSGATERTKKIYGKVEDLFKQEMKKGGVLDVATEIAMSIDAFRPGYIDKKNELIVGLQTDAPLKRPINPFGGIRMVEKSLEDYGYKMSPELLKKFTYRTTHNDAVFAMYNDEMRAARRSGVITGLPDAYGRGRLIGDHRRIPLYGLDYMIEQKSIDKARLSQKELTTDNLMNLEDIGRQISFLKKAKEHAAEYGLEIGRPAQNAHEAVQWLYFSYLCTTKEQNGAANSIGRIGSFLDIYINRDLANGTISEEFAQELIDDFVIKLRMIKHLRTHAYNELFAGDPTWVTISEGGVLENGKHQITKTSYRILNTLYNLSPAPEPNITILWHKKLPKAFKQYCARVSIDTGSIQYENDEIMQPHYGDDYSISCCVSALKNGKQMQYFGARCNIVKTLLMALNGGRDEVSGDQIGPADKVFDEGVLDYKKVIEAYKKYRAYVAKLYVNTMNIIHYSHDRYAYERFTMGLYDSELERLMAFGICGLSVLADSLSAIKYAKVTAIKNEKGLITDFKIDGDFPKFGNDDDRVDKIATWIVEDFSNELKKHPCYRNARHTLSVLTITSNVVYGKMTGSTPCGRHIGEAFAPGANPMHGRDLSGAIASLNSVAKIDYSKALDGVSNTFSVVPDALGKTEKQRVDSLVGVLDGYFNSGAHHLNVNVLQKETLEDAMKNPEKYPLLTIRVSGYAVRFNKLNKAQQEEVISRTFHSQM